MNNLNNADNSLERLLETKDALALLWEGNDSWLIKSETMLFAFDLDLFNPERIKPCTLNLELLCNTLDMLLITHEHEDHFNTETCKLLNEKSKCIFVIPKSCVAKAKAIGIQDERMIIVEPKTKLIYKKLEIECVRAIHGHIGQSVYSGANCYDCGYLITIGNQTLYQPGDTILLEEHSNMPKIDILFISPTDHNMKIKQSADVINSINPKYIFPQHHSTYVECEENMFWSHGYVDELYNELTDIYRRRFIKLVQGAVWMSGR